MTAVWTLPDANVTGSPILMAAEETNVSTIGGPPYNVPTDLTFLYASVLAICYLCPQVIAGDEIPTGSSPAGGLRRMRSVDAAPIAVLRFDAAEIHLMFAISGVEVVTAGEVRLIPPHELDVMVVASQEEPVVRVDQEMPYLV